MVIFDAGSLPLIILLDNDIIYKKMTYYFFVNAINF
jgi:hypothetical protein